MWRRAQDPVQKKAILDQFLPLTRDDYVSAVIAFADDENDEVRSLAFEKLKALDHAVLIKRVRPDMSRATVRTLARLCVADPNPQLIAALVNSKRLTWPVIKERWLSPNEELWRALIVNRSFILLSHPDREAVLAFLKTFSASLTAAYREQLGWVTPKELKEFVVPSDEEPRPPEPPAPVKAPADKSARSRRPGRCRRSRRSTLRKATGCSSRDSIRSKRWPNRRAKMPSPRSMRGRR